MTNFNITFRYFYHLHFYHFYHFYHYTCSIVVTLTVQYFLTELRIEFGGREAGRKEGLESPTPHQVQATQLAASDLIWNNSGNSITRDLLTVHRCHHSH